MWLLVHVFMGRLHGLSSKAHVLEYFSVSIGILQSLSLKLNGGQCAVNLGKLLLISLLSFQRLKSRWGETERIRGRVTEYRVIKQVMQLFRGSKLNQLITKTMIQLHSWSITIRLFLLHDDVLSGSYSHVSYIRQLYVHTFHCTLLAKFPRIRQCHHVLWTCET